MLRKWPGGLWHRRLSGASGSGGCHEVRGLWGCQDARGSRRSLGVQELKVWSRGHGVRRSNTGGSGGRRDFRSPGGGQGAMGSGDLVQVVQEVIRISGA